MNRPFPRGAGTVAALLPLRLIGLLAAALIPLAAPAQPLLSGSSRIRFELDRLATSQSVLMIGAHPDDELNGLLAHLGRRLKMRTAYLSLTRGEGGQNLIGTERGEVLGVIRTEESFAAGRLEHADRFFTSAVDFGYSKSAEEALRKWDRQRVLGEIVAIIRRFRPETVISVWSGTSSDGHGQHQAAGILTREAFEAASDASRFPEAGGAWNARRFLLAPRKAEGAQAIETGVQDAALGYSPSEIGVLSRTRHRSQGQGEFIERGSDPAYLKGDLSGWNLTPPRGLPFDTEHPEALLPKLFALKKSSPDAADLDELIALCAGVWVDARVSHREFVEGELWLVTVEVVARSTVPVQSAAVAGVGALPRTKLHEPARLEARMKPAADLEVELHLPGGSIRLRRPIVYRYADNEWGERTAPPVVLPPVTLRFGEETVLFPDAKRRRVSVDVRAARAGAEGDVLIEAAKGWQIEPARQRFRIEKAGQTKQLHFEVTPPADQQRTVAAAVATVNGRQIATDRVVVNYSHIPIRTVLTPATSTFARSDIQVLTKRVGYVPGAGDLVPEALRRMGLDVELVDASKLASLNLSRYDALVLGVRAFNVHPDLGGAAEQVLNFARAGGVVVVQYNTAGRGLSLPIAPYPLDIGSGRVSVEEAPVVPLDPRHPLWTAPNALTSADFEGWVQERGLYFASKWDARYTPLVSSHDPDEQPLNGALLYTRLGKGAFIYTGLSFFRQLPAGVPGAYRLFANILSVAKHAPAER